MRKKFVADPADRLTPEQVAAALAKWDGLIWQVATYWHRKNPDLDLEDLHAEARYGFLEGAQRFQPSRGYETATYCRPWANMRCRVYVSREVTRGLRVPKSRDTIVPVAVGSLESDRSDVFGAPYRNQIEARGENPVYKPQPDFWETLGGDAITDREREVLRLRFRDEYNLAEVGQALGVSKERARQLQILAITKLRESAGAKRLADALG